MKRSVESVAVWSCTAWVGLALFTVACTPRARSGPGAEYSAVASEATVSFPFPRSGDTAWAEVYVPPRVTRVRAAVVFIDRNLDRYAYDDRDWRTMCGRASCALVRVGFPTNDGAAPELQRVRNAVLGGDSAVLTALRLGGERTGHTELQRANVVLFGVSAAGNFGATFAALHPDRTIGFIRYHSHLRGLRVDTAALASIPALTLTGARDERAGIEDSRALWSVVRARGAPWAYVNHIGQPHVSIDGLVEAGSVMRDWTEAVILRRLSTTASLISLGGADGWVVDDSTGEVGPTRALAGRTSLSSWVPDARTAFGLRQLQGMCAQVPLSAAISLLGSGTRLADEDASVCHFVHQDPQRDLWVSASSHASDSAAVAWLRQAQRATSLAGLGDAANLMLQAKTRCSTIGAARSTWTFYVSACGDGFGVPSDSARLRPISRQVLGELR